MSLILTTRSANDIVHRVKGVATQLFRHLRVESTSDVDSIRYLGITYDNDAGDEYAIMKLLGYLDMELFYGCPISRERRGISGVRSQISASNFYKADQRDAFFDRYETMRDKLDLRLFSPGRAQALEEGSLPDPAWTFAIGAHALTWVQLLPCTIIPLVPFREGKPVCSIDGSPVSFKYEKSTEQRRSCALMYGQLRVDDPDAVFVLDP
jgi:hypothetical protein